MVAAPPQVDFALQQPQSALSQPQSALSQQQQPPQGGLVSGKLTMQNIGNLSLFLESTELIISLLFLTPLCLVTVPPGISPGQTIHVAHPDGSGRLIKAVVPHGIITGGKFLVRGPPSAQAPPAVAEPVGDYSRVDSSDYSSLPSPIPFSQALDNPEPHMAYASPIVGPSAPPSDPVGKSLLRVQVPQGSAPGSTIHVQVPGENRLIAVQVPPNCTHFHVQYEPRVHHKTTPIVSSQESRNTNVVSQSPPGQKLLLVRVPQGATTGTTLHVQVPNESGRVLQAQVPPGQVKEFHVSYQPRVQGNNMQSQQQQQRSHPVSKYNINNQRPNNNGGWGSAVLPIVGGLARNKNGGRGSAALPIVGGLATGAAAAMAYSHFAHANDGQNDQDQGDYNNDGGDYGGGDMDYGGGDMDFGGDF